MEWNRRQLPSGGRPSLPGRDAPPEVQGASDKIWELASRASRLEGELESHSKKLEAIEKRGRGLRAEIGRKVEDLAGEESRALRDASSERDVLSELILKRKRAQREHHTAQAEVKAAGDHVERIRRAYESLGATRAQVEVLESVSRDYERRARSKRRGRLRTPQADRRAPRPAETIQRGPLKNDLQTGRERIASRVGEALTYEKAFSEASNLLLDHLRDKTECRELLEDIDKRRKGKDPDEKTIRAPRTDGKTRRSPLSVLRTGARDSDWAGG